MLVVIVGCGHVGLVTGAGLAADGHTVVGVDSDPERVATLQRGETPFFEPGLDELLTTHRDTMSFTASPEEAVDGADVAFICVSTPKRDDGRLSLVYVEQAARALAKAASGPLVIIEKSTVPVSTARRILHVLQEEGATDIEVATNPEFTREGSAVQDTLTPDRIIVGLAGTGRAEAVMRDLYAETVRRSGCQMIVTDLETAELIKHASNSYLAMKISYMNAVAMVAEQVGADIDLVAQGMSLDPRIGPHHLKAGLGYGGSCFPKDVSAFIAQAGDVGVDMTLLSAVRTINDIQRARIIDKAKQAMWNLEGKVVAVWGLAFKPGTDDLREAPSLDVIPALEREGATVRAFDPAVGADARSVFPHAEICSDAMSALEGADALVVLTDWSEFADVAPAAIAQRLSRPVVVDGRNLWPVQDMADAGFTYLSFGRPDVVAGEIRRPG